METSAIGYRVADFLKRHPPFQAMAEADLVGLAARGRVRFHEAHEYVMWQGEPHKLHVFVIQQGTVSLFDEAGGHATLRDVRGPGDMLGVERFTGAPCCLYSARSTSDVLIYSFPASDFEELVLKYPYARQFVEAYDTVTADYQWAADARDPQAMFLHTVVGHKAVEHGDPSMSIRDAARSMLATGSHALAVVDSDQRLQALVTADAVLAWVATGARDADQPIAGLLRGAPPTVAPSASVVDGMMALAEGDADLVAVTSDGSASGRIQAIATSQDIARVFGDQPNAILREIQRAASTRDLRALNHRVRALALQYLTSAASLEWLAPFVSFADASIVRRIIALTAGEESSACWCVTGASGRGESLTRHAPELALIVEDDSRHATWRGMFAHVLDALAECDYLDRADTSFDRAFHVASAGEWRRRYAEWLQDPVGARMDMARSLFDLRVVHGRRSLWREIEVVVAGAVDRKLLYLVANDCMDSLPPLTFFQDAIVEESGETAAVFRLEQTALRPLVDVGRVFGLAAKRVLGTSTAERFALARTLLPEHESLFREASETLRILLWQQARIGIGQGTTGAELPPALLSRHDRHVLKRGFRSILRLIEFTGSLRWVPTV